MGRDNSIYGLDETGMAERISGEALRPSGSSENVWGGGLTGEKGSKGNATDPGEVKVKSNKESDSRAKTSGNHGKQD